MITNGQLLLKSFHRVKKSSMGRFGNQRFGGLKPHEFFMLVTIQNRYAALKSECEASGQPIPPGMKISELSRCSAISMPGVSQTITNLVKHDYVRRITTEADRRLVYVNLTEKGAALEKENSEASFRIFDEAAALLGEDDTKTLIALLDKLSAALEILESNQKDKDHQENAERKKP